MWWRRLCHTQRPQICLEEYNLHQIFLCKDDLRTWTTTRSVSCGGPTHMPQSLSACIGHHATVGLITVLSLSVAMSAAVLSWYEACGLGGGSSLTTPGRQERSEDDPSLGRDYLRGVRLVIYWSGMWLFWWVYHTAGIIKVLTQIDPLHGGCGQEEKLATSDGSGKPACVRIVASEMLK